MKRLLTWLLAAAMLMSLTACTVAVEGPSAPPEASSGQETPETPEPLPEDPEEPPEDPSQDPPEEDPDLGGLTSAPAYAIYPEYGALDDLPEDGTYTSKEDVALYIYGYNHLPDNFITKKEARELGWSGGSLEPYAPGTCIGGDRFGNYEGLLPQVEDRTYYECDVDTLGASSRGAKRLVFCYGTGDAGAQVYYTGDHYESFQLVYGDDAPQEAAYD